MLSAHGRVTAVSVIVLVIVGRILGITELFGVAVVAALLVVVAVMQVRTRAQRVSVSGRVAPGEIVRGEQAVLELFCENIGSSPAPAYRLQLVPSGSAHNRVLVPRLAPFERAAVAISLDTGTRGKHLVRGYDAVLTDALGLAQRRLASSRDFDYLVRPRTEVLPRTLPVGAGGIGFEITRSAAERLRSGASLLRPYVEGDDLRRVHWRTTARIGDLMVREGGEPDASGRAGTTVALVSHAQGADARFERAVEVAASIVRAGAADGAFRLVTSSGYDSLMASGPAHLEDAMIALSTLVASSLPPLKRGNAASAPSDLDVLLQVLDAAPGAVQVSAVTLVVQALRDEKGTAKAFDEVAAFPHRSGPIVWLLIGGDEARIDRLDRDRTVMTIPLEQPLEQIWSAPVDVVTGELVAVRPA